MDGFLRHYLQEPMLEVVDRVAPSVRRQAALDLSFLDRRLVLIPRGNALVLLVSGSRFSSLRVVS